MTAKTYETITERTSDRELTVTRILRAPLHFVYQAWSKPELMVRWWMPKSFGITFVSCEMDVRTGGTYRFEFGDPASDQTMTFYGKYLEVVPEAKIVWTNDEETEGAVTTVTFEDLGKETRVVVHDLYPSKEALEEAIESGSVGALPHQFDELETLFVELEA